MNQTIRVRNQKLRRRMETCESPRKNMLKDGQSDTNNIGEMSNKAKIRKLEAKEMVSMGKTNQTTDGGRAHHIQNQVRKKPTVKVTKRAQVNLGTR